MNLQLVNDNRVVAIGDCALTTDGPLPEVPPGLRAALDAAR